MSSLIHSFTGQWMGDDVGPGCGEVAHLDRAQVAQERLVEPQGCGERLRGVEARPVDDTVDHGRHRQDLAGPLALIGCDRACELVARDRRQAIDIERARATEHRRVRVEDRVAGDGGERVASVTSGDEPHGSQHGVDRFGRTGEQHGRTLTRVGSSW